MEICCVWIADSNRFINYILLGGSMSEYKEINLGGYEGSFACPNCGDRISIKQGNGGEYVEFKCHKYEHMKKGCGKKWRVYAKEVKND